MERNQKLTSRSQTLRKMQTKEENLLWYQFLKHYPCLLYTSDAADDMQV